MNGEEKKRRSSRKRKKKRGVDFGGVTAPVTTTK